MAWKNNVDHCPELLSRLLQAQANTKYIFNIFIRYIFLQIPLFNMCFNTIATHSKEMRLNELDLNEV